MPAGVSSALNLDLDDPNELDRRLIRVKVKAGDQAGATHHGNGGQSDQGLAGTAAYS
jgi:hypothetical protein